MSLLALLLLAVGAADLVRGDGGPVRRYAVPAATGGLLAVVVAALAGLGSAADLALLAVALVTMTAWVVLADAALRGPLSRARIGVALATLAVGGAALVLLSGAVGPVGGPLARWLEWTAVPQRPGLDPDRLVLLAGLFLVQTSTGNLIVRMALGWGGAGDPQGPQGAGGRLRGGRLLGPMERVFILGLGLAGQLTAAGIVIAAKGLIRWPELQAVRAGEDDPGIDTVTEYFLVGSFASWLVALASLALVRIT